MTEGIVNGGNGKSSSAGIFTLFFLGMRVTAAPKLEIPSLESSDEFES